MPCSCSVWGRQRLQRKRVLAKNDAEPVRLRPRPPVPPSQRKGSTPLVDGLSRLINWILPKSAHDLRARAWQARGRSAPQRSRASKPDRDFHMAIAEVAVHDIKRMALRGGFAKLVSQAGN